MTRKIQHRRGLEANIVALDEGELGFTTDTKKLFIGTAAGNKEFLTQASLEALNLAKADFETLAAEYELDKVNIDKIPGIQQDIIDKGIVESGYLEGAGYYKKYGDGTMDVWNRADMVGVYHTGDNATFTIPLPDGFIIEPVVVATASIYNGSADFASFRASAHLNGVNLGNFYGHVHIDLATEPVYYIAVNYQAQGKWVE